MAQWYSICLVMVEGPRLSPIFGGWKDFLIKSNEMEEPQV